VKSSKASSLRCYTSRLLRIAFNYLLYAYIDYNAIDVNRPIYLLLSCALTMRSVLTTTDLFNCQGAKYGSLQN